METIITLGELIEKLKNVPQDLPIYFDFCGLTPDGIDSYRGYYDQLAVGWKEDEDPKVSDFLKTCEEVNGQVLSGYKGGNYKMGLDTNVWVSNWGRCAGTAIFDVLNCGYCVIIKTGNYEG